MYCNGTHQSEQTHRQTDNRSHPLDTQQNYSANTLPNVPIIDARGSATLKEEQKIMYCNETHQSAQLADKRTDKRTTDHTHSAGQAGTTRYAQHEHTQEGEYRREWGKSKTRNIR